MTKIENNMVKGIEIRNAQFLNGSPDCRQYTVKIKMDGTPIDILVKQAINAGLIVLRKKIKTKDQALKLADGITFSDMVSASAMPADPNALAATLDVDSLDDVVQKALLEKLLAAQKIDE